MALFDRLGRNYFAAAPVDAHEAAVDIDALLSYAEATGTLGGTSEGKGINATFGALARTSLQRAAARGYAVVVALLVDAGAEVNAKDTRGDTALSHAAAAGFIEVMDTLLAAGADVNQRRHSGATPLHRALKRGHTEACKVLVKAGADLSLPKRTLVPGMPASGQKMHVPADEFLPLFSVLVERQPEVAIMALDARTVPVYRVRSQIGRVWTSDQWAQFHDAHVSLRRRKAKQAAAGEGSLPPLARTVEKTTIADSAKPILGDPRTRTTGVLYRMAYDNAEEPTGASPVLAAVVRHSGSFMQSGEVRNNPAAQLEQQRRKALLTHPWVTTLIDHKWRSFARRNFTVNVLLYTCFLSSFLGASSLYRDLAHDNAIDDADAAPARVASEYVLWILACALGLFHTVQRVLEARKRRLEDTFKGAARGWALYDAVHVVTFWTAIGLRASSPGTERSFSCLALLAPLFWLKTVYYLRFLYLIGPLVRTIQNIVRDAAVYFVALFLLVVAFAHGFHMSAPDGFATWHDSTLSVFAMGVGYFDVADLSSVRQSQVPWMLYVAFNFLCPMLLGAYLIAMITTTYGNSIAADDTTALLQRANLIVQLQGSFGAESFARRHYHNSLFVLRPDAPIVGLTHLDTAGYDVDCVSGNLRAAKEGEAAGAVHPEEIGTLESLRRWADQN